MKPFSNNQELYEYLLLLSAELKRLGLKELSEVVAYASQHAAGMSTEFIGESRIALLRVLKEENGFISIEQREYLRFALKQLDDALDKR